MSENDFECFASTGVNTPETTFPSFRRALGVAARIVWGMVPTIPAAALVAAAAFWLVRLIHPGA
jgi:hypothetical protein